MKLKNTGPAFTKGDELSRGHFFSGQGGGEVFDGLVDGFAGELKGAEMDADALRGTEIAMGLHGIRGIQVDGLHEPAGFVGADGQQREVRAAKTLTHGPEMGGVPGIRPEIERAPAHGQHVTAPQTVIPVEQSASGEMLGGGEGDFQVGRPFPTLPPIEFHDVGNAERHQKPGMKRLLQTPDGGEVQVVVVIMAEEDEIDARQLVEGQAG